MTHHFLAFVGPVFQLLLRREVGMHTDQEIRMILMSVKSRRLECHTQRLCSYIPLYLPSFHLRSSTEGERSVSPQFIGVVPGSLMSRTVVFKPQRRRLDSPGRDVIRQSLRQILALLSSGLPQVLYRSTNRCEHYDMGLRYNS